MKNKAIHGGDIYRNQVRLDFSVNVNPLGMPDGVEEALHEAVSSVQEYPDMEALALKESLAEKLAVPEEKLLFRKRGFGASDGGCACPASNENHDPFSFLLWLSACGESSRKQSDSTYAKGRERVFINRGIIYCFGTGKTGASYSGKSQQSDRSAYFEGVSETAFWKNAGKTNAFLLLDECFIEFCEGQDTMLSEIGKEDRLLFAAGLYEKVSLFREYGLAIWLAAQKSYL